MTETHGINPLGIFLPPMVFSLEPPLLLSGVSRKESIPLAPLIFTPSHFGLQYNALYIRCLYLWRFPIFWSMRLKSPELIKLGKAIRTIREKRGFSQDKFAYEIDLGRSYYGSIERGEINVSFLTLLKITRGLGVTPKTVIPSDLK